MSAPFNKGDWVGQLDTTHRPLFGKIKACYVDHVDGGWCADIVYYDTAGHRVGRSSEPCGGPTSFEPAVPTKYYAKIVEPSFPLRVGSFTGNYTLQFIKPSPADQT